VSHELGAANYAKGDYVKAADFLRQALQEDPKDNEASQLLGLSYYLSGRPAEGYSALGKSPIVVFASNVNAA